jgi:RHS repeat-associated protein
MMNSQYYSYFPLGARQYDAETGRFLSIDPLFEQFRTHTPYHYAFNSPV